MSFWRSLPSSSTRRISTGMLQSTLCWTTATSMVVLVLLCVWCAVAPVHSSVELSMENSSTRLSGDYNAKTVCHLHVLALQPGARARARRSLVASGLTLRLQVRGNDKLRRTQSSLMSWTSPTLFARESKSVCRRAERRSP